MILTKIKISDLFEQGHTIAWEIFDGAEYPWEILDKISSFIEELGKTLPEDEYTLLKENVWIANDAKVAPTASISGPCIIDHGAEIRHCAFIRGSAIVGKNSVVGNSCELKNCMLFDGVQVPHFNYVGDSILGYKSHMGAGSITSNVKSDKTKVTIRYNDDVIATGLKKMGAILGNYVEVGCNSVLNPGTIIGSNTNVYPLSMVRGYIPKGSIYKRQGEIVEKSIN